ncbi:MAG TPA: class I SAM-dependent methyltransferase [Thermoanaerobaculia bacterium]|nr:class I SAM-dependent methyltransferase [Thermoanaerobaculia bacterium]
MRRLLNGLRKVAAGLRPFNESVWPGAANDLFVAHTSIYDFFSRFVSGKRVLDAGCGTGYGAARLIASGARSVVGVDIDGWSVRYARRHYGSPLATFARADIEHLAFEPASFDVITSSNAMEHLQSPASFLTGAQRVLASDGMAIVAVPPILSANDAETHAAIHYHRSNLTISQWHELFANRGFHVDCYAHRMQSANLLPDFASTQRSTLSASDFVFDATDLPGLQAQPTITAIFVLQR